MMWKLHMLRRMDTVTKFWERQGHETHLTICSAGRGGAGVSAGCGPSAAFAASARHPWRLAILGTDDADPYPHKIRRDRAGERGMEGA